MSADAKKVKKDLIVNYAGLAIAGAGGILLNFLIAKTSTANRLGIFNQAYAIYIISAQLAVLGVHYSTYYYSSAAGNDDDKKAILTNGLILGLVLSIVTSAIIFFLAPYFAGLFESPNLTTPIQLISLALVPFSANKILLQFAQSRFQQRVIGIAQGLRIVSIISLCALFILSGFTQLIEASFVITEILLAIFLGRIFLKNPFSGYFLSKEIIKKHFKFGARGFFTGTILELNARVDILILGYFASDKIVGIYSIATSLFEGFAQLLQVIRNQISPNLTTFVLKQEINRVQQLFKWMKTKILVGLLAIATACTLVGALLAGWFFDSGPEYSHSFILFYIMSSGFCIAAPILVFDNIFIASGRPTTQTFYTVSIFLTNLILNILLISKYGDLGGAIAVSATNLFNIFTFLAFYKKTYKSKLF